MNSLRSPLVHFLLFGGLIFAVQIGRLQEDPERVASTDSSSFAISIDSEKIEELRATHRRRMGRPPSTGEQE